MTQIGIVGGGGFGLGIAQACQRNGHSPILWSRKARAMDGISQTQNFADLKETELIYLAVPSPHMPDTAKALGRHLDGRHLLVHVSRGLVGEELTTLTQVLRKITPCRRVGALAGPLDAEALSANSPGGAIVGTRFPEIANAVRTSIGKGDLRIYFSPDVIGVEVASATVGLIALTLGYAREAGVGAALLALFCTRAMAECTKLGKTLGAKPDTMHGLAGYGDLLAVMGGDERPESRLGAALAQGQSLTEAGKSAGAHIEGVTIARRFADHALRAGVEAPISNTIAEVIEGTLSTREALSKLMAGDPGRE